MNAMMKWFLWVVLVSLAAGCASSGSDSPRESASTYRSAGSAASYGGGSCH